MGVEGVFLLRVWCLQHFWHTKQIWGQTDHPAQGAGGFLFALGLFFSNFFSKHHKYIWNTCQQGYRRQDAESTVGYIFRSVWWGVQWFLSFAAFVLDNAKKHAWALCWRNFCPTGNWDSGWVGLFGEARFLPHVVRKSFTPPSCRDTQIILNSCSPLTDKARTRIDRQVSFVGGNIQVWYLVTWKMFFIESLKTAVGKHASAKMYAGAARMTLKTYS